MELELGLKIIKLRDDNVASSMEFRMAKDHAGPIFISREIDSMFILSAHLKGYRREEINIDINKDGTKLTIHGDKPTREILMWRWRMHNQDSNMRFIKVFRIPRDVILDGVKATFEIEDSVLTITMPKSVRGISGNVVEELKEEGDEQMSENAEGCGGIPKEELANHEDQIEEPATKIESFEGNKKVDRAADTFLDGHKIEIGKQMEMTEERLKHSSKGKNPAMGNQGSPPVTEARETTVTEKLEPEKTKEEMQHPNFIELDGQTLESAKHEEGPEESTRRLVEQVTQQSGTATAIPSEEDSNENKTTQLETQHQEPARMHTFSGESKRGAEPVKGLKQMKTLSMNPPADGHEIKNKLRGGEESSETEDEVPGKRNGSTVFQENIKADTQKSVVANKPKGRSEQENRAEKHASTSSMFFSPCFFTGSAILVGLIMLMYQLIRSKKR